MNQRKKGVGLGKHNLRTVEMGREMPYCTAVQGQDLVSHASQEGNPWCQARAYCKEATSVSKLPGKILRRRLAGHCLTQALISRAIYLTPAHPSTSSHLGPYVTNTEQAPTGIVALFLLPSSEMGLLLPLQGQGHSSSLNLSRGLKGLCSIPFKATPALPGEDAQWGVHPSAFSLLLAPDASFQEGDNSASHCLVCQKWGGALIKAQLSVLWSLLPFLQGPVQRRGHISFNSSLPASLELHKKGTFIRTFSPKGFTFLGKSGNWVMFSNSAFSRIHSVVRAPGVLV